MKEKRITQREAMDNPIFTRLLEGGYFRLLGVMWTKKVVWFVDQRNLDFVFQYE